MVGLEDRQLRVRVDAGRAEQPLLGADQRKVAPGGGAATGGQLRLTEPGDVLGERLPLGQPAPARDRLGQVSARGGEAGEAGFGGG